MTIDVAILGGTGVVGQKTIAFLQNSSIFVIKELVASDQHLGKTYAEAVNWREPLMPLPKQNVLSQVRLGNNLVKGAAGAAIENMRTDLNMRDVA